MSTPSSSVPRPVAGAAILDLREAPQRFLAAQRRGPASVAGLWEFPGGKLEPGEAAEQAVERECLEELGVRIRVLDEVLGPDAPQEHGWPLAHGARMRVFRAELVEGRVTEGEQADSADHSALRWIPLRARDALAAVPWIPADEPIVRALCDGGPGES